MKEIRIITLRYQNFMGAQSQEWRFDGRDARILGGNGTGKTTAYHAFTWLLFGKDSHGNADFDLKPRDASGGIADHGAVTSAEAELTVDGAPLTLRRTWYERWTTRRGGVERKFDGHTSEFYLDGVPVQKKAYDDAVRGIAEETLFHALTSVTSFAELDWRARRELLLAIIALPDDKTLMETAPEGRFQPLREALGRLDVDGLRKKLLARRGQLNGAQSTLPARMDEQARSVEALRQEDYPALRAERDRLQQEEDSLRAALAQLENGAAAAAKRTELAAKETEKRELEVRNREHRASQRQSGEQDRSAELRAAVDRAAREAGALTQQVQRLEDALPEYDQRIQALRARREEDAAGIVARAERDLDVLRTRWAETDRELKALDAAPDEALTHCPTCGQLLPPEQLASALEQRRAALSAVFQNLVTEARDRKARMEADKAAALELAEVQIERQERLREEDEARLSRLRSSKREALDRLAEAQREAEAYVPPEAVAVEDLPEYGGRMAELSAEAESLREELSALDRDAAAVRSSVSERLAALRERRAETERRLALESQLEYARHRCEELREEARRTAAELEALDKTLSDIDAFTRYKVSFVDEAVNSRFSAVSFRMFEAQINGGLRDCCDVLVGGVRFGKGANTGAEIAAGLEIISVLSEHYGLRVPVFVDGCESVERLPPIAGQVIRLEVDKRNRTLRLEKREADEIEN